MHWLSLLLLVVLVAPHGASAEALPRDLENTYVAIGSEGAAAEKGVYQVDKTRHLLKAGRIVATMVNRNRLSFSQGVKAIKAHPGFAWAANEDVANAIIEPLILIRTAEARKTDAAAQAKIDDHYEQGQRALIKQELQKIRDELEATEKEYAIKHAAHQGIEQKRADAEEKAAIRALIEKAMRDASAAQPAPVTTPDPTSKQ